MELAKALIDNCGMTILGTLRSNKKLFARRNCRRQKSFKAEQCFSLLRQYYFGVVCARQEKEKRPTFVFHAPSANPGRKWKTRDCNLLQQYKKSRLFGSDVCPLFFGAGKQEGGLCTCSTGCWGDLLQQHEKKWWEHYFEKQLLGGAHTFTYTTLSRRKSCSPKNEEECKGHCEFGL